MMKIKINFFLKKFLKNKQSMEMQHYSQAFLHLLHAGNGSYKTLRSFIIHQN